MVAQAQFSTAQIRVQPGESESLSLTLFNLGNHTETFTLVPSGLLAGWVRIEPPTVTLFGGSHQEINVTVRPPQLASTPAGPAPLTVRIIPLDEPDDVIIAETTATIGSFDDRRVHMLQPVLRSRRRATFEMLVENQGNAQANCRLHLIDTTQRLDGDFDPPAVGIEPGGKILVRLRMKAIRRHWGGGAHTIPFSIEADQQGFATAVANATFVQTAMVPDNLGRRILGLIVLAAALGGAWFGLIRPATRRAARDAVRNNAPAVVVTTTATPVVVPTGSTVAPPVTVPGTTGGGGPGPTEPATPTPTTPVPTVDPNSNLFSHRFVVVVKAKASNQDQYQVPAGKTLLVTDLIIQNVQDDMGFATVLDGDQIVTEWNLSKVFLNNDPLQFVTPKAIAAGSTLTFKLDCDATGISGQDCSEGLLLIGKLVDA